MYNRVNESNLFFKEKKRREQTPAAGISSAEPDDKITQLFGQKQPADLPESSVWWKKQQKDLAAIADITEHGIPQAMITVTQSDSSPELLAAVRRGPGAKPTECERLEYLK
eukprot:9540095-Karenia_brevis.AAC.1